MCGCRCASGETPAELAESLAPLIEAYLSEDRDAEVFCAALAQRLLDAGAVAAPPQPLRRPPPPGVSPSPSDPAPALVPATGADDRVQFDALLYDDDDKEDGSDALSDEAASEALVVAPFSRAGDDGSTASRAAARKSRKQKSHSGSGGGGGAADAKAGHGRSGGGGGAVDVSAVVARLSAAGQAAVNDQDDYSSAWEQCKAEGRAWGGRSFGGRGVNRGGAAQLGRDAVVQQLTLSYGGKELLREVKLVVAHGRRYGLVGANGVGKTTLLRRIASGAVPGWPQHLTTALVHQEVLGCAQQVLACVLGAAHAATSGGGDPAAALEVEQAALEALLLNEAVDAPQKADAADRLCEVR